MDNKKNLVILFGGQSSEHDVSCVSGATVAEAAERSCGAEYNIILVGITKGGRWLLAESIRSVRDGSWEMSDTEVIISQQAVYHELIFRRREHGARNMSSSSGSAVESIGVDVVFPVLHGLYGEDGTVQGLLKLAGIPFAGCGHLSSAITMDKFFTKIVAAVTGVAQAAYVPVRSYELCNMDAVVARVEAEREYPVFIKPSNAGSSVGITKAHDRDELIKGLKTAAENDSKILVEETITGREIECAVFGYGDKTFAAGLGEVVAAAEFYDFDAKYNNEESKTVINPALPAGKAEEIKDIAVKIYKECDCFGFARVDFFLEKGTDRVVFNEINTIPGHTPISMYPMIMEAAGYSMDEYVKKMVEMASERQ